MNLYDEALSVIALNYTEDLKSILGEEVYRHSLGVMNLALEIADVYNMNLQEKLDIAVGSLLHDIGKGYVNQDMLNKTSKLNKDERLNIEWHPTFGYRMLKRCGFNKTVLSIIKCHHERIDGGGYPDRLNGKSIDIYTQIVSVADVYEALTSDRVYHSKRGHNEAMCIMKSDEGLNQMIVRVLDNLKGGSCEC